MATNNITVSGTVRVSKTGLTLANVKVVAWDKDPLFDDKLGEAVTDDSGHFSITFEQEKLEDIRFGMRWESYPAEVYFEIRDYTTDDLIGTTEPYSLQQDEEAVTDFDISVDVPGATLDKSFLFALYEAAGQAVKNLPTDSPVLQYLKYKAAAQLKREIGQRVKTGSTALREHIGILNLIPWAGGDFQFFLKQFFVPYDLSRSLLTEASSLLKDLAERDEFKDPLRQELRVRDNPLLIEEFQLATVLAVANMCGLAEATLDLILGRVPNLQALNDLLLADMVKQGQLAETEAKTLGLSVNLYHLLDEQLLLSSTLAGEAASIRDLTRLNQEQWVKRLTDANVTPPEGQTLETYAQSIMGRVSALYPTAAFFNRVALADPQILIENLEQFSLEEQIRISHRFPRLGLKEVLIDEALGWDEKKVLIAVKLNLLDQFWQKNAQVELLSLDYSPDSEAVAGLNMEGFSTEERQILLASLRAYQRIFALSRDTEPMPKLLEAGYDSATSIANGSFEDFMAKTGLGADVAKHYYQAAWSGATAATLNLSTVTDFLRGGFDWIRTSNLSPEDIQDFANSFLRKIDGFDDLFGNQAYCKCEHCQSILSPAAYFVDLMHFVQKKVINEVFSGDKQNHPLNLKTRRPDLWSLALTCENTNVRIPTLDIINEILENYIAQHNPGFKGDIKDRGEVEKTVYEHILSRHQNYSFNLPFVLPLEQLETYLRHFNLTRASVAKALGFQGKILAAAKLKLVLEEYERLTTPATDPETDLPDLRMLYGINFKLDKPMDLQEMLKPMGLTRSQFGDLIATKFVQAGANPGSPIVIEAKKLDEATSVQNDVEDISNLTTDALDRMYRFTRLWRCLPWTMWELDLVIAQLCHPAVPQIAKENWSLPPQGYVPGTLEQVADVWSLQERFGAPVETLCSFFSDIPQEPRPHLKKSLFDRLFNISQLQQADGGVKLPITQKFVHPALDPDNPSPASATRIHRLLAGLQVSDGELCQLIEKLPSYSGQGVSLDVANLSFLFRHARLAEFLKLSLPKLFQMLDLAGIQYGVSSLTDLKLALDFYDWWKATVYSLDDLTLVTGKKEAIPAEWEPIAKNIIDELIASNALVFAETVFAGLPKNNAGRVTETESLQIIDANKVAGVPHIIEPYGAGYRLTLAFTRKSPVKIPGKLAGAVTEDDVRNILLGYHPDQIIPNRLGSKLRIPVDNVRQFIDMSSVDLFDNPFVAELWSAMENNAAPYRLAGLIKQIVQLKVLFVSPVFDAPRLEFVSKNRSIFDISLFIPVSIEGVKRLSIYAGILDNTKDADFSTAQPAITAEDLESVLADFGDPNTFYNLTNNQIAQLARVLKADAPLVRSLLYALFQTLVYKLPSVTIEAVKRLGECTSLAKTLGVSGGALLDIIPMAAISWPPEELPPISTCYTRLSSAANAIFGVFRAKYQDEKTWEAKIGPFEDRLRSKKRDALVEYLLRVNPALFESADDLYYYFLIDVKLEGCARTSRVVAAISSVQVYVHRILLNLEQDRLVVSDPNHLHVQPKLIPKVEWEWRKKYRVWEANRKVFLYPENYLEPALRDDKTPLFETLESELLTQDIKEQTVLDAYANYLKGFEEVANLKIAGACLDQPCNPVIMHLIGVTPSDPPIYYYRTFENPGFWQWDESPIIWSPWRKINVQIPVRKASPVVYRGQLHLFWAQWRTKPFNDVVGGTSKFVGYQHRMSLNFSTLKLDGTWTSPQPIRIVGSQWPFESEAGLVKDHPLNFFYEGLLAYFVPPLDDYYLLLVRPPRNHDQEALEDYTLKGVNWDSVFLHTGTEADSKGNTTEYLEISARNFRIWSKIDLFNKRLSNQRSKDEIKYKIKKSDYSSEFYRMGKTVVGKTNGDLFWADANERVSFPDAFTNFVLHEDRWNIFNNEGNEFKFQITFDNTNKIASCDVEALKDAISIIGWQKFGSPDPEGYYWMLQFVILQLKNDVLLLSGQSGYVGWHLKRLSTSVGDGIVKTLFTNGVNGLLNTNYQLGLKESEHFLKKDLSEYVKDCTGAIERPDFSGPYGVYFREMFFHIPYLIANHLNSQGRYADAQKWYHYIFDPTAEEETALPTDRNWRYAEFRSEFGASTLQGLRKMLEDSTAIGVWENDPFNPHAIARLRLSAYQKSVVMKYIDNLLDWGDSLFSQFTMESVNEATLLYVLASDLLGPRPPEIGECGEGDPSKRTYENIAPLLGEGQNFLIEMETQRISAAPWVRNASWLSAHNYIDSRVMQVSTSATRNRPAGSADTEDSASSGEFHGFDWKRAHIASWTTSAPGSMNSAHVTRVGDDASRLISSPGQAAFFTQSMALQSVPVFCVPVNKELLGYWDRVENRLFNIRNCRDIQGVRRDLELFEPELDPRLLMKMKEAEISLEDVMNVTSGNLPPYRFAYLIEKAKSYAGTLQSIGNALLSAMEKKDVEQLNKLKLVHEQNLQTLTKTVKNWEVEEAQRTVDELDQRIQQLDFEKNYLQGLIDEGLIPPEQAEQVAAYTAKAAALLAMVFDENSAVSALIPQLGSPFSLNWGGIQFKNSLVSWTGLARDTNLVFSQIAEMSAIQGQNQRREENWSHSLKMAEYEFEQAKTRKKAAEFKRDIAIKSRDLHTMSVTQTEEISAYYGNKFSTFGLYTWLSTTLQRLYREAYDSAYSMAKLAEQAFCFERDENSDLIAGSGYWDPAYRGLLSGEQLLLALETLEKHYIETNYRRLEIDQAFSLVQLDPAALLALQEKGECEFDLPEFAYDLFYPGHYRRKIKAVRVTLPCVTGPYTNVSATLRLISSKVRTAPTMDSNDLVSVPPQRTVSIAMSSGNNDAGVFELNFHDERYMPFEGAGAISHWKLTLPNSIRPFDYQTITDVVMRISYTAQEDESLRLAVEGQKGQVEDSLIQYLSKNPLRRVFSLRDEFTKEFGELTASPGAAVNASIPVLHFPFFLRSAKIGAIKVEKAIIAVRAGQENKISDLKIEINSTVFDGFQQGSDLFSDIRNNYPSEPETDKRNFDLTKSEMDDRKADNLWISNAQTPIDWIIKAEDGSAMSLALTLKNDTAQISPEKDNKEAVLDTTTIQDILLCIEYTIVKPGT